jgi:hypothetical protein
VDAVGRLDSAVSDLAWLRLEPWREAIASVFDAPAIAAGLAAMRAVEVHGPINEARLIAGWLASRLGVPVELEHSEREHVECVTVRCGEAAYVVERRDRGQVGRAYGPEVPEHPVVLPILDASTLLGRALDGHVADPVFEAALASALEHTP